MVSMSGHFDWDAGIVNRNFFILQELVRRDDVGTVITLDFPPFSRKMIAKEFLKSQMANPLLRHVVFRTPFSYVQKRQLDGKVYYRYASLLPHLAPERFLAETQKIFHALGLDRPVLWSFDPLSFSLAKRSPHTATVFDTVDNWAQHPSFAAKREELEKAYDNIAHTADVIFTVSEDLQKRFPQHPRTFWIPNAVDEHLSRKLLTTPQPKNLQHLQRPIVGYMGIIQSRVDLPLVASVAMAHPDKTFVLVGPTWPVFLSRFRPKPLELQRFRRLRNVYFLGRLPFAKGLRVIRHCDVVMIPHVHNALTQSMNPMKLYEALALGRPVVTTPIAGLEPFREHIEIATDAKTFGEKIAYALKTDSPERQQARQKAVSALTWKKRVHDMMQKIPTLVR